MKVSFAIIFSLIFSINLYSSCVGTDEMFIEFVNGKYRGEIFSGKIISYDFDSITKGYVIKFHIDAVYFTNNMISKIDKDILIQTDHGFDIGSNWLIYSDYNVSLGKFIALGECDQRSKKILPSDSNVLKELEILNELSRIYKSKITKRVEYFYANGILAARGNYLNGLPDGYWEYYYLDGKPKTHLNYKDGLLNGERTRYNKNGFIESYERFPGYFVGYYGTDNGKIHYKVIGDCSKNYKMENYYINGQREFIKLYKKNNVIDTRLYYENGCIKGKGRSIGNNKTGKWKYYDENGNILSQFDADKQDPTKSNISVNQYIEGLIISIMNNNSGNCEIKLIAKDIDIVNSDIWSFSIILPSFPEQTSTYKVVFQEKDEKMADGCAMLLLEKPGQKSTKFFGFPNQSIKFQCIDNLVSLESTYIEFRNCETDSVKIIGANVFVKK
ncbi:MAG: hypothetical protein NT004_14195 [Bacteroidetes bacterium]|nr:hypothetical protein [Bacteroidota bacterium]